MKLIEALRITCGSCIAFVGAGGKTTAIFKAAREICSGDLGESSSRKVFITTTTQLGAWQAAQADHHYAVTSLRDVQKIGQESPGGVVLVTGEQINDKLTGLSPLLLGELQSIAESKNASLLIEADGAHMLPLKAPAEHEPAIPDFIHHVVVVAGLKGLGKPLTGEWVHRADHFAALSGLRPGQEITTEALSKVLLDKHGGLKSIPCGARRRVILNQADTPALISQAEMIGRTLLPTYDAILITAFSAGADDSTRNSRETSQSSGIHEVITPVAGIVLAAGGSSRFGEPKQLLPWHGQPILRHAVLAAINGGLSPVVVVLGSSSKEVQRVINDLPVRIVNNLEWSGGLSTSIKAGLREVPSNSGAAVFLQGDQPQVPPSLIRSLVETHQKTFHQVIAPLIDGRRGNPVLFDSSTFTPLLALEGDSGGRELFGQYPVHHISWQDPGLLIDIDTPEDYSVFLKHYPDDEDQP